MKKSNTTVRLYPALVKRHRYVVEFRGDTRGNDLHTFYDTVLSHYDAFGLFNNLEEAQKAVEAFSYNRDKLGSLSSGSYFEFVAWPYSPEHCPRCQATHGYDTFDGICYFCRECGWETFNN